MRMLHVITPGDHFSPLTGSAIPTVVHGLCKHRPTGSPEPWVAVARGTYTSRYESAAILEYEAAPPLRRLPRLSPTQWDALGARIGLPRFHARHSYRAVVADQESWAPSVVIAHNGPQLVPQVDTVRHAPLLYAHNSLLRTYRRREAARTLDPAAGIICVSEYLADETAGRLPNRFGDRIRVVRNGVDLGLFRRRTPLRSQDALQVLFVGRMIPEKGADTLVEAVRALNRDDIHLTLVGSQGFSATDPPSAFERRVRELAAGKERTISVKPFAPRDEVASMMGEADVVVVPSRWDEPFALTTLEGMASGAAVVGADVGGIPESLRRRGLLVPPGAPLALAEALAALADDEGLLRSTAAAGQAYAQTHDWSRAARELDAIVSVFT